VLTIIIFSILQLLFEHSDIRNLEALAH